MRAGRTGQQAYSTYRAPAAEPCAAEHSSANRSPEAYAARLARQPICLRPSIGRGLAPPGRVGNPSASALSPARPGPWPGLGARMRNAATPPRRGPFRRSAAEEMGDQVGIPLQRRRNAEILQSARSSPSLIPKTINVGPGRARPARQMGAQKNSRPALRASRGAAAGSPRREP